MRGGEEDEGDAWSKWRAAGKKKEGKEVAARPPPLPSLFVIAHRRRRCCFFSLQLSFSIALSPRLCLPLFPTHSLLARMPAVTVEPLLPPQPTSMTLFVFKRERRKLEKKDES